MIDVTPMPGVVDVLECCGGCVCSMFVDWSYRAWILLNVLSCLVVRECCALMNDFCRQAWTSTLKRYSASRAACAIGLALAVVLHEPCVVLQPWLALFWWRCCFGFVGVVAQSDFQGNIHLENVRLKETALAALDLPIDVTFGIVKRVVIKIPWTKLTTKPTILIIDGIHALIRNRTDFDGDEAEQERIRRRIHLRGIEAFEKMLAEVEEREIEMEKNDGKVKQDGADAVISSKFLVSIVDNLQVTIRNIHLR